jgi:TolB protein
VDALISLFCCCIATATPAAPPSAPAPPGRHASLPAASPDGKEVVFCSDRDGGKWELYIVDVTSGISRRITYSNEEKAAPGWTDSGTRIAYAVTHGDTSELKTVAPDGSGTRTVLTRVAKSMRLSASGRRLAYTLGSWTRNRIWVANADGSHARAVTDSSGGYFNLAWSPDEGMLAATHQDSTGALQIWLVNPDTVARPRELVRLPASEGRPQWPAWSPDGGTIAFQAGNYVRDDPTKSDAYVCLVDVVSGTVSKLRTHPRPWLDETPSWLDREHIAFQSTQTGPFEVWVMKSDGSGARSLTK